MVIISPGSREVLPQPISFSASGLAVSQVQWVTLPLSSFTSNSTRLCGLDHRNFVTVASLNVVILSWYAAFPWCASTGPQTPKTPTPNTNIASSLLFIQHLVRKLYGSSQTTG